MDFKEAARVFVAHGVERPVTLSIIIISYNTRALTLDALDSLFRNPPLVSFEVIVLDNASSDGSFEAIDAAFPEIGAIALPHNVGFAAGNNIAAERARGRRILLLNPDTVILQSSLRALWEFAEREPERWIWGGRTLFPDLTLNPTSCWGRMTLWSLLCSAVGLTYMFPSSRLFNSEAYGDWKRDTVSDVDIVTGCFLLIDFVLWRRLGGFDSAFFMYAEEADLCIRASRVGARPGMSPDAEIIHLGGMSEASSVDKVVKTMRGRVTLMKKHWSPSAVAVGRALLLLWSWLRLVGSRIVSGPQDAPGSAQEKWSLVWRRRGEWLAGYDCPRQLTQ